MLYALIGLGEGLLLGFIFLVIDSIMSGGMSDASTHKPIRKKDAF